MAAECGPRAGHRARGQRVCKAPRASREHCGPSRWQITSFSFSGQPFSSSVASFFLSFPFSPLFLLCAPLDRISKTINHVGTHRSFPSLHAAGQPQLVPSVLSGMASGGPGGPFARPTPVAPHPGTLWGRNPHPHLSWLLSHPASALLHTQLSLLLSLKLLCASSLAMPQGRTPRAQSPPGRRGGPLPLRPLCPRRAPPGCLQQAPCC